MRAYLVTAIIPTPDGDDTPTAKYAASQSEAANIKREWFEQHKAAGLKRGSIETEEVEIPTSKSGLIPWINENLAS